MAFQLRWLHKRDAHLARPGLGQILGTGLLEQLHLQRQSQLGRSTRGARKATSVPILFPWDMGTPNVMLCVTARSLPLGPWGLRSPSRLGLHSILPLVKLMLV